MRILALWLYLSAISASAILSEWPPAARAAAAGLWIAASLAGLLCCTRALARWARARRGWTALRAGRCAACAYPLLPTARLCPECGHRPGAPPDAPKPAEAA